MVSLLLFCIETPVVVIQVIVWKLEIPVHWFIYISCKIGLLLNEYFQCGLISSLFSWLLSYLVYEMSEKVEKCWVLSLKAQHNIIREKIKLCMRSKKKNFKCAEQR